jgi:hypothetical protein
LIGLFNQVTQNDLMLYVHLYNYKHIQYLNFLKVLIMNGPLDTTTHLVTGQEPCLDMQIYDDATLDLVVFMFSDIEKTFEALSFAWKKLKSNGTLILRNVPSTYQQRIHDTFIRSISNVPSTVSINIFIIENIPNTFYIKKPCY